jgi:hypothetical protein
MLILLDGNIGICLVKFLLMSGNLLVAISLVCPGRLARNTWKKKVCLGQGKLKYKV